MPDIHFKPTIGRVLHYRVGGTDAEPELRPATVVRAWSEECLNVVVDFDGGNDRQRDPSEWYRANLAEADMSRGWRTSVSFGDGLGMLRWPARV